MNENPITASVVWDAINNYILARDALIKRRATGELMNADFVDAQCAAARRIDALLQALTVSPEPQALGDIIGAPLSDKNLT